MDKGLYINEINPGARVHGVFCVASKDLRSTRAGKPYIALELMDATGTMEARVWEDADRLSGLFDVGDYILIDAEAQEYNEKCQLKLNTLAPVEQDEVELEAFVPVAEIDRERAWDFVKDVVDQLEDRELGALLEALFSDPAIAEGFRNAPAARRIHHAAIGGLMEHSLSVLLLCRQVASLYPHLNQQLLEAAAICHDIGKIKEFSWQRMPIDYTKEGRLLGHIAMGIEMLAGAALRAGLDPESDTLLHLKHIVLSHHGRREYGSPVLPMTEEAMVFHMMDDLDAKINYLGGLKEERDGSLEEDQHAWSSYQRLFERFFLLNGQRCLNPARQLSRYLERGAPRGGGAAGSEAAMPGAKAPGGAGGTGAQGRGDGEREGASEDLEQAEGAREPSARQPRLF